MRLTETDGDPTLRDHATRVTRELSECDGDQGRQAGVSVGAVAAVGVYIDSMFGPIIGLQSERKRRSSQNGLDGVFSACVYLVFTALTAFRRLRLDKLRREIVADQAHSNNAALNGYSGTLSFHHVAPHCPSRRRPPGLSYGPGLVHGREWSI